MSELLDICKAISAASHQDRPKGLSPNACGRLKAAIEHAEEGKPRDLEEEAPKMLIDIGNYWQRRFWEWAIEDLEFEVKAHRRAVRYSPDELRAKVAEIRGDGASNSAQHLDGLNRMGSGTRPNGSAMAGEAAAGTFEALRPYERALEIAEELCTDGKESADER